MSKESFERGLGRKFTPARTRGKPKPMRAGKTARDKATGAWGRNVLNRGFDPARGGSSAGAKKGKR